ncbi:unnamed protein product [Laminaria digitata]
MAQVRGEIQVYLKYDTYVFPRYSSTPELLEPVLRPRTALCCCGDELMCEQQQQHIMVVTIGTRHAWCVCVCVLHVKPFFLPVDIQHTPFCTVFITMGTSPPVRADSSNPRETRSVATNYDTETIHCSATRRVDTGG